MLSEAEIETYLHDRVEALGGEYRRTEWTGRKNAPDDRIMLPGRCCWVECKKEGGAAKMSTYPRGRAQLREHERMRALGEIVHVIDSKEAVDRIIA